MPGGVLPSVEDLQSTSRCLKSTGQLRTTTSEKKPDVFDLDNDTTRAIMSCGHAVGRHIFQEIISLTALRCIAIPDYFPGICVQGLFHI